MNDALIQLLWMNNAFVHYIFYSNVSVLLKGEEIILNLPPSKEKRIFNSSI